MDSKAFNGSRDYWLIARYTQARNCILKRFSQTTQRFENFLNFITFNRIVDTKTSIEVLFCEVCIRLIGETVGDKIYVNTLYDIYRSFMVLTGLYQNKCLCFVVY